MITLYSRFWKAATLLKISLDKQSSKVLFGRETLICLQFDNYLICYLKKKKKKQNGGKWVTHLCWSLCVSAAKSLWAAEAPPCRWESGSGGKEEAPGRRPEFLQQETSCRPAPAGPEPHRQRQEGQGPQEVRVFSKSWCSCFMKTFSSVGSEAEMNERLLTLVQNTEHTQLPAGKSNVQQQIWWPRTLMYWRRV